VRARPSSAAATAGPAQASSTPGPNTPEKVSTGLLASSLPGASGRKGVEWRDLNSGNGTRVALGAPPANSGPSSAYQLTTVRHLSEAEALLTSFRARSTTDQQMDEWLKEYKDNIIKEAFKRLDIEHDDPDARPLMIGGPAPDAFWGKGADKVLRFSRQDILLFFLTKHHVATFQCILDLGTGLTLRDQTKEFPYKDITNLEVETVNTKGTHINGKKVNVEGIQRFSLFTSGTNRISIDYSFERTADNPLDYRWPPSDAESTIKAVRRRLKDYKDRYIQPPGGPQIPTTGPDLS